MTSDRATVPMKGHIGQMLYAEDCKAFTLMIISCFHDEGICQSLKYRTVIDRFFGDSDFCF